MERRAFFKLVGLSAAACATPTLLSGCTPSTVVEEETDSDVSSQETFGVADQPEVSFNSTTDVLIIGTGVTGLSCALPLLQAGYQVTLCEKQDKLGGDSYESDGIMYVAGSKTQEKAGIKATASQLWDKRKAQLERENYSELDFARKLFEASGEWADVLADDCASVFADPKTYSDDGVNEGILLPKNGIGDMVSVLGPLRDTLTSLGAVFQTGYTCCALISNNKEEICGARFVSADQGDIKDIRAAYVVMATGGFVSSQALVNAYAPDWVRVGCYTVASDGQGQLLCEGVGGQLSGMDNAIVLTSDVPAVAAWGLFGPTLDVSPLGERIAPEDTMTASARACVVAYDGFWWTIFTNALSEGSQSRSVAQVVSSYKTRTYGPYDDVSALASGCNIPSEQLEKTFEAYEKMVDDKKDSLGRTSQWISLEAPYYAFKQIPVRCVTHGGVVTDDTGQVQNAAGQAIVGLYCCGSAAAKGGQGLASNGAFGMLTGRALVDKLNERKSQVEASSSGN